MVLVGGRYPEGFGGCLLSVYACAYGGSIITELQEKGVSAQVLKEFLLGPFLDCARILWVTDLSLFDL